MKRAIVTGASGFIGRQAATKLLERGFDVVAFTSRADAILPAGVERHVVDLTDADAVRRSVKMIGASHLLHCAWRSVVSGLWTAPENLTWVRHTLDLVEAFAASGGERMTGVGTCGEYDWAGGLCAEDRTPLTPATYYGACKHALESLLGPYAALNDLSFAWGRVFFVYGPGEHESRLGASVVKSLLSGEPALCSHGMQLRDYMHVADVADGLAALLDSDAEGAFNIATGEAIRVKDLINALAEEVGRPDLVQLGAREAPAFEPPLIVADMAKTRNTLNWSPRYSLESGARDTVAAFRRAATDV